MVQKSFPGDIAFFLTGPQQSILKSERLTLNIMQRMSELRPAHMSTLKTYRSEYQILDTRKTTPGVRFLEKEAVRIGGGVNHRMGLYDMIMLKDNHVDYAGGIETAITATSYYLKKNKLNLKVEIEARSLEEVRKILSVGLVDRIMLDNFSVSDTLNCR